VTNPSNSRAGDSPPQANTDQHRSKPRTPDLQPGDEEDQGTDMDVDVGQGAGGANLNDEQEEIQDKGARADDMNAVEPGQGGQPSAGEGEEIQNIQVETQGKDNIEREGMHSWSGQQDSSKMGSTGKDHNPGDKPVLNDVEMHESDDTEQGSQDKNVEKDGTQGTNGQDSSKKGANGKGCNPEEEEIQDDEEEDDKVEKVQDDKQGDFGDDEAEMQPEGTDSTDSEGKSAENVGTHDSSGKDSSKKGFGRKRTGKGSGKKDKKSAKDSQAASEQLGTKRYPIYIDLEGDVSHSKLYLSDLTG